MFVNIFNIGYTGILEILIDPLSIKRKTTARGGPIIEIMHHMRCTFIIDKEAEPPTDKCNFPPAAENFHNFRTVEQFFGATGIALEKVYIGSILQDFARIFHDHRIIVGIDDGGTFRDLIMDMVIGWQARGKINDHIETTLLG